MNAARTIPPKVGRILPTLGNSVDGEALGAARAIGRVLERAGLTYHDLAAAIRVSEAGPSLGDSRPYRREASPQAQDAPDFSRWRSWRATWARDHRPRSFTPRQETLQQRQAEFCRHHVGRLSERERKFVFDIEPKRSGLTIRQNDWLAAIIDRLDHEHREFWQ